MINVSASLLLINQTGFFIDNFNMLWIAVLAIGIVIIFGFLMVSKRKSKQPVPTSYKAIHIVGTIIGAVIALIAALMGDTRIWVNVILAVLIVVLGVFMGLGKLTKSTAKPVLYSHAVIAIVCYTIFLYYIIALECC